MIIEKAVNKAKKTGSNLDYFLKSEITKEAPENKIISETQHSVTSRVVEIDEEYIASQGCLSKISDFKVIESYKILRTRLDQSMLEKNSRSLMITSAFDTEGKTLTAINLAFSFSKHYHQTVLLVDCDLRKQNIYKYLGYSSVLNLVDYLVDDVPLSDVMIRLKNKNITIISGERTVEYGAELLSSSQMINLFNQFKNRYNDRIIIFDLPPVLLLADAIASSSWIDSILFVVQFGKTSFKDIKKSIDRLPRNKFLGFVINRSQTADNGYDKYYI